MVSQHHPPETCCDRDSAESSAANLMCPSWASLGNLETGAENWFFGPGSGFVRLCVTLCAARLEKEPELLLWTGLGVRLGRGTFSLRERLQLK